MLKFFKYGTFFTVIASCLSIKMLMAYRIILIGWYVLFGFIIGLVFTLSLIINAEKEQPQKELHKSFDLLAILINLCAASIILLISRFVS